MEGVHVAAVEVQADAGFAVVGHAGHVDMVGVGHKAGHRSGCKQDDAAARQGNVFIGSTVRFQADIAALFQHALQHAHHAPAAVVVHRRPLPGLPHQCIERQAVVG